MIALISMAMLAALSFLAPTLDAVFDEVSNSLATPEPAPPPAPTPSGTTDVHYEDCDAVRAAGAAPIRVGDPGYSPELDPDGDGIGCE